LAVYFDNSKTLYNSASSLATPSFAGFLDFEAVLLLYCGLASDLK